MLLRGMLRLYLLCSSKDSELKTQNEAEDGLVDKRSICVLVTKQRATKAPSDVDH